MCPDNMPPDRIDYSQIDSPLIPLIKAINKTRWMFTIGSCAGASYHQHPRKSFYIIIEVKGLEGMRNFIQWCALAHKIGFEQHYIKKKINGSACYQAFIESPNLLHHERGTGAVLGLNWFRFTLSLIPASIKGEPKENTCGAIFALSEALRKLTESGRTMPESKRKNQVL